MRLYKRVSFSLMIAFAVVGLIFLFMPGAVLTAFNIFSEYLSLPPSPTEGMNFYLVLAVAYMYVVTLLAYNMFCCPDEPVFPLLLAHGKLASALLSVFLFIRHQPYLIYISNGILDGSIGLGVLFIWWRMKKALR